METLKNTDIITILAAMADVIIENRDYLNELDGKLGDADFGTSIAGGFMAVQQLIPELHQVKTGTIVSKVGMTLVKTMGGASGPLFGTIFMKAGKALGDQLEIGVKELGLMLTAGLEGVKTLGKSKVGDKTLIDALEPATLAIIHADSAGQPLSQATTAACIAAICGLEATKTMIASRGRAYYVGERGLGHQDAGATAILMLFTVIRDYIAQN